jgi:hypothetical protein
MVHIVDSKQISSGEPESDAASYHRNVSYAIAYTRQFILNPLVNFVLECFPVPGQD